MTEPILDLDFGLFWILDCRTFRFWIDCGFWTAGHFDFGFWIWMAVGF
jgi:hypothetical protein